MDCPDPLIPEDRMALWIDGFSLETILAQLADSLPKPVSIGPKILPSNQYCSYLSLVGLLPILTIVGLEPKGGYLIKKFPGGFHGQRYRIQTEIGESLVTLSSILKLVIKRTDRWRSIMVDGSLPSFQVRHGHQRISPRRLVTKAEQRFIAALYEDDERLNEYV